MIEYSFSNDMKFQKGRDDSFTNFMIKCKLLPQHMAVFSDNELKVGLKGLSNAQVEQRLTAIVRLFCCLHSRDTYIKAYTEYLAKRLLNKSLVSIEAEELMISKFKVECGINTVNKMTHMFKDIETSKNTQAEFIKYCNGSNIIQGVEFNTEILTNGQWPMEESITCKIPEELHAC